MTLPLDSYDLVWAILGFLNLSFSLFSATAAVKSRTEREYDLLLGCIILTGLTNLVSAYIRHNTLTSDDSWFAWGYTITLVIDSLLNLATAARVVWAYHHMMADGDRELESLEAAMPLYNGSVFEKDGWKDVVPVGVLVNVGEVVNEKS
ncbi:hypothetical protein MKEN_01350500 [Mycena kentingensis (nom. inval.)]|nr:hypothetical protein MKEN_01350500 [Mycena kentingensis (nom. inval.)]